MGLVTFFVCLDFGLSDFFVGVQGLHLDIYKYKGLGECFTKKYSGRGGNAPLGIGLIGMDSSV